VVFNIEYLERVGADDIPALPKKMRVRILKAIDERLTLDPISFGKPLRYDRKGTRSMRVGDYRIIFQVEYEIRTVLITKIGHRREVYEGR